MASKHLVPANLYGWFHLSFQLGGRFSPVLARPLESPRLSSSILKALPINRTRHSVMLISIYLPSSLPK